jgi:sulfite exporter TauE/SafE
MFGSLSAGLLGLAIGARHALEPDHLAAVCTVVADPRTSRRATSIGAAWGLGHAAALLGVGTIALCARAQMPEWLSSAFELGVAVMLLALGVRGLRLASKLGRTGPALPHSHGDVQHAHAGPQDHLHAGRWTLARRPFVIGLVHGLAGSGALTAWAVASASSIAGGVLYILSFGIGSIVGMAALTGALGASFRRWVRSPLGQIRLAAFSGALSIVLSVTWGYGPLLALAGV